MSPINSLHPYPMLSRAARILLAAIFIASLALSFRPVSVKAATTVWFVKEHGTDPTCSSWATACTLATALKNAQTHTVDQIWVQAGTYYPGDIPGDPAPTSSSTFLLKSGVALYGGFTTDAALLTQRSTDATLTILSGDIAKTPGDPSDDAYHVVTGTGADNTAILDGFTITHGNARLDPTVDPKGLCEFMDGGGMYTCNTSPDPNPPPFPAPTLNNLIFSSNLAQSGGGFYNGLAITTLNHVTFTDNHVLQVGGGLYSSNGVVNLFSVVFKDNGANLGGGMYAYLNSISLVNVVFAHNSAGSYGGGLVNQSTGDAQGDPVTVATLTNVTFNGNSATNGGAMYNLDGSHPTIVNSILYGDSATNDPEIFNAAGAGTDVTYSDINDASAPYNDPSNIHIDPQFGSAPTVLRLQYGSPAIDKGSNSAAGLSGITSDVEGGARFFDLSRTHTTGTTPQVDMGAYEARPIFVKTDAAGLNNGSNWTNAYTSLQTALLSDNTAYHDYWVAQGTYGLSLAADTFTLDTDDAVYGGFTGSESLFSQRASADPAKTVLTGNATANHVVTIDTALAGPLLDGFTITSGSGGANGGGMMITSSSPTLNNLAFVSNSAGQGGALFNDAGSNPRLTNVIFSANTATGAYGGAIYNNGSSPTLINVTFSGNHATTDGDAIASLASSAPVMINSILWDSPSGHAEIYKASSTTTVTYSDVRQASGTYSGTNNINQDPLFISGHTAADLHLQAASPAVDTGSSAAVPAGITTDILGNPRIIGDKVDMGAYETMPGVASITRVDASPTNATTVHYTVTFNMPVSNVVLADFALTTTLGQSGASLGSISGSGKTRTVTVNTASNAKGTLRLDLNDRDTITSISTPLMLLGGTGTGNGSFTSGEIYTINTIYPAVTINQAADQADPVFAGTPVKFTVVFSTSVSTFDNTMISYVGSTAAGLPYTTSVTGPDLDGVTYHVTVNGITGTGQVIATIPQGKVGNTDFPANKNLASTSTDNSVTIALKLFLPLIFK